MSPIIASLVLLWSLLLAGPCCAFIVTHRHGHFHASVHVDTRTSATRATTSNDEGSVEDDQQLSAAVARIATSSADTSRRDILLRSGFAAAAAAVASPPSSFAAADGSAFVATYSDPKHPGGNAQSQATRC